MNGCICDHMLDVVKTDDMLLTWKCLVHGEITADTREITHVTHTHVTHTHAASPYPPRLPRPIRNLMGSGPSR